MSEKYSTNFFEHIKRKALEHCQNLSDFDKLFYLKKQIKQHL